MSKCINIYEPSRGTTPEYQPRFEVSLARTDQDLSQWNMTAIIQFPDEGNMRFSQHRPNDIPIDRIRIADQSFSPRDVLRHKYHEAKALGIDIVWKSPDSAYEPRPPR